MTYWLAVVKPEVWAEAERDFQPGPHLYGFPEGRKNSVKQMKVGDRIVEYMTKPRKVFFAAWEITEGHRTVHNRKLAGEEYPECVLVRRIKIRSPDQGIPNKWRVAVRMSARELPHDVGESILNAL